MSAKSFKQMIRDGEVKRADAMKVRLADLHEEPGFNLRREGEDLAASIETLADHIAAGGMVPALEVRPRDAGGVWIVDGHRRRRAYLLLVERGAQIADASGEVWVPVVAFAGNDADRTARILTSAEGRSLAPLEVADGYARLIAFGWSADQIAAKIGKTRQHVDNALVLARANADVQALVAAGSVSATAAIDAQRKHGDAAGAVLGGAVDKAKAAGKAKATGGAINGKPLPRWAADALYDTGSQLLSGLSVGDATTLSRAITGSAPIAETVVSVPVSALIGLRLAIEAAALAKEKQARRGVKPDQAERLA